ELHRGQQLDALQHLLLTRAAGLIAAAADHRGVERGAEDVLEEVDLRSNGRGVHGRGPREAEVRQRAAGFRLRRARLAFRLGDLALQVGRGARLGVADLAGREALYAADVVLALHLCHGGAALVEAVQAGLLVCALLRPRAGCRAEHDEASG